MPNAKQNKGKTDVSLDTTSPPSPPWHLLPKHSRYLSPWEADAVVIDTRHSQSNEVRPRVFHLQSIHLAAPRGDSLYHEGTLLLVRFPHLLTTLKIAINATLWRMTEAGPGAIRATVNDTCRLYIWMMRRGIYHLASLERKDTDAYAAEWATEGWWRMFAYDEALRGLLLRATKEVLVRETLGANRSRAKEFTINLKGVELLIGLPLPSTHIPGWFRTELHAVLKSNKLLPDTRPRTVSPYRDSFARMLAEANQLALHPAGFDSISFLPFLHPRKEAVERLRDKSKRTANLSLPDAVKIFSEAVKWVFDYAPGVIELLAILRDVGEREADPLRHKKITKNILEREWPAIRDKYKIPFKGMLTLSVGSSTLSDLISTTQIAAFCLIASNHARRRNEVIGEGKRPYGLYFGCVRPIAPGFDDYRLDIYIEKSFQDYGQFWCNDIVKDCVHVLEQISQECRDLGTERKTYSEVTADDRGDKLFRSRSMTWASFRTKPDGFRFTQKSRLFFELAGVRHAASNEVTHPFRRFFCLLYFNRYDNPILLALMNHLGHEMASTTKVYGTDADGRKEAEAIEILYRKYEAERNELASDMTLAGSEYFQAKILQLLMGEEVGGIFPRIIHKVMQRFSASIKFQSYSLDEKAHTVSNQLTRRGYFPAPNEHGACMAGTAKQTRRVSNCFADGDIHPEKASVQMCEGCAHIMTTKLYRTHLLAQRDDLLDESKNFRLPAALRLAIANDANQITDFVNHDAEIAFSNQKLFGELVARWQDTGLTKGAIP